MEKIYNKWQLQDKDLGNNERYQFTKSEVLDFAKYYSKQFMLCGVMDWVAVEDNLPPKYENVIIRNENNIISTDQINDEGWVYEKLCCLQVTHWMHLPKPPCA